MWGGRECHQGQGGVTVQPVSQRGEVCGEGGSVIRGRGV